MNQSFLVDELTKFFFPKKKWGKLKWYLTWVFLCSSLLLYCWWVPEIIRPNLSSFRHRFFPTFLGPEGLSVAGSKDEQCPSGPHLLWYPCEKERPGRSCSKELTGWNETNLSKLLSIFSCRNTYKLLGSCLYVFGASGNSSPYICYFKASIWHELDLPTVCWNFSGQRTIDVVAFEVALEILAERCRCRTVRGGNPKGALRL